MKEREKAGGLTQVVEKKKEDAKRPTTAVVKPSGLKQPSKPEDKKEVPTATVDKKKIEETKKEEKKKDLVAKEEKIAVDKKDAKDTK